MRLQLPLTKTADWSAPEGPAGNIDFTANAFPQPFFPRQRGNAFNLRNFSHEFMSGNSTKAVIPVQQFHIRVANPRQPEAYQCPAGPQLRQRLLNSTQLSFVNLECEQSRRVLLTRTQRIIIA